MRATTAAGLVVAVLGFGGFGCMTPGDALDEEVGAHASEVVSTDALALHRFALAQEYAPALVEQALPVDTVPGAGGVSEDTMCRFLRAEGCVNGMGVPHKGEEDVCVFTQSHLRRQFVAYAVSCALPAGQTVEVSCDGRSYSFAGQVGLAPDWATRGLDGAGQRWVSSCMLARVNATATPVQVDLRGRAAAIAHHTEGYFMPEGVYFGNLFRPGSALYSCRNTAVWQGPGVQVPPLLPARRVCGPGATGCAPFVDLGSCDSYCDAKDETHRSLGPCVAPDGTSFVEAVSVYLAPPASMTNYTGSSAMNGQ